ncbi:MAG: translation initiation factor IF-2 [Candidatus Eremiobacteraeota bacterium]|nr:translation initiation factor IF-2 [Candidatus Eremiobacteraeota bacterium]
MAKIRVYELAKETGQSNKDLLDILKELGIEAKTHQSGIEEPAVKRVMEVLEARKKGKAPLEAPAAKQEKKPVPMPAAAEAKTPPEKDKGIAAPPLQKPAVERPLPPKKPVEEKPVPPAVSQEKPEPPAALQEKPEPPAVSQEKPVPPADIEKAKPAEALEISFPLTLGQCAQKLGLRANDIIRKMMDRGQMVAINKSLEKRDVELIAELFSIKPEAIRFKEEAPPPPVEEEDPRFLMPRPPVVTILGHVDHGKTSLLDSIRKTNVTASEAGGITQKIGAYTVEHEGKKIVFVDTPGHEAFTAMRARGAQVTDIAILVVAADDGVMPQTIEAINHARAAKVPIIVAINKIDKPQANPDRVKQQLADLELLSEDWGGDTICIPVSAREKTGIDELLEMIILVAEMQELKANPKRRAHGIIIESKLDKGLGPVATVLVQKGTLRLGDSIIAGLASGKVRVLINDKGERIKKATPSIPAEIVGLSEVPRAGDVLQVVRDEKLARQITLDRVARTRERTLVSGPKTTLEDVFRNIEHGEKKELNIIVRADGQGSVEALRQSLVKISDEEVKISVIHSGVGTVSESDILLANASQAIIIGFNIRMDPNIKKLAEQEKIDIRLYNVIYHVIEDIKLAMKGMLEPEYEEVILGRAEVRQVFRISKIGVIAGSHVLSGKILRSADVRVMRGTELIHQGRIDSLKRFKDDVKEVLEGFECGIGVEKFDGLLSGDILEAYQLQKKER